jgi:CBS domain-containing protein
MSIFTEVVYSFAFRTIFLFASSIFSILFIMLLLGIITADDVAAVLKLSPEATTALKTIMSRIQEVGNNLLDILSQLVNKLFGWAGVDADLNKIKIDVNRH